MLWAFGAFWRENLKSFTVEVVRRQTGREETTSDCRVCDSATFTVEEVKDVLQRLGGAEVPCF